MLWHSMFPGTEKFGIGSAPGGQPEASVLMRNLTRWAWAGVLVPALLIPLSGQDTGSDITVDAASRAAAIEGLLKEVNDFYIDPDVAARMVQDIRERQQKKEYDAITRARQ